LGTAKAAQREMAFKGAAFEGSSAAMMMVDEHCHIMFANPACNDLIATLMPNLQAIWPSATADGLEGAQLTDLAQLKPTLDAQADPG
jgi:methyl-accepting chemotaxis protein